MEQQYKNNAGQGFAVAGLVIGLVALIISFIPCVGAAALFIGGVAVVFSSIALARLNKDGSPRGLAIGGLTVSIIAVIMAILWITLISEISDRWRNRADDFFGWQKDSFEDEFDNSQSLEELENALDELEGTLDSVSVKVDTAVNQAQQHVKKAIDEARDEIKKHQDE
jgi:predicted PurR-regulated permease PerM